MSKQINDGKQPEDTEVDMKLSVMEPLSARWIISAYNNLRAEVGMCVVGLWRQESVRDWTKL